MEKLNPRVVTPAKPPHIRRSVRPSGGAGVQDWMPASAGMTTGKKGVVMKSILKKQDPALFKAILGETQREAWTLELIASENMVSEAVLEAQGSVLTNKYAEGYPGKRYYGGCEFVD